MRPEGFNEADYREVRSRVLTRIRRRRRVRPAVYAAAATVILACGLWTWRLWRAEAPPLETARVIPAAPLERTYQAPAPVHLHRRAKRVRALPAPPGPTPVPGKEEPVEPLLVKLETPDPNVVIYWIVEGKGD